MPFYFGRFFSLCWFWKIVHANEAAPPYRKIFQNHFTTESCVCVTLFFSLYKISWRYMGVWETLKNASKHSFFCSYSIKLCVYVFCFSLFSGSWNMSNIRYFSCLFFYLATVNLFNFCNISVVFLSFKRKNRFCMRVQDVSFFLTYLSFLYPKRCSCFHLPSDGCFFPRENALFSCC